MKLSKTQTALLKRLQAGEKIFYMRSMGSFNPVAYFFLEHGGRCTAAAYALIKVGFLDESGKSWDPDYKLSESGKAWREDAA